MGSRYTGLKHNRPTLRKGNMPRSLALRDALFTSAVRSLGKAERSRASKLSHSSDIRNWTATKLSLPDMDALVLVAQRFSKPHSVRREGRKTDSAPVDSTGPLTAPYCTTRKGGFKMG